MCRGACSLLIMLSQYLIKTAIYDPKFYLSKKYIDFWTTAVESTMKHLIVHPYGFPELSFISQTDYDGKLTYTMDDYSCFAGGNFLLGGAYLGRKDFEKAGLALADSCHRLYNTTASGLNPLAIAWYGPENKASNPVYNGDGDAAKRARQFYDKAGYFLPLEDNGFSGLYTLYPEPIESMFYAYRITGDPKWQDRNWDIFQSIRSNCQRGEVAACSVSDVLQPKGGDFSFFGLPRYVTQFESTLNDVE